MNDMSVILEDPDIVIGAHDLSMLIFQRPGQERAVFHLAETSNLPFFKIGSKWAMRRSKFMEFIEKQENGRAGKKPRKK